MKVTKTETKESTKHSCGYGYRQKDSAEHEGEGGAHIGGRTTENNLTNTVTEEKKLFYQDFSYKLSFYGVAHYVL